MGANILSIYDVLVKIPMTKNGCVAAVYKTCDVSIPPFSEAVLPVKSSKLLDDADYMVEGELKSPCRSLMVAKTSCNPARHNLQCKVLNPTNKAIKLRAKTPIGSLHAVTCTR